MGIAWQSSLGPPRPAGGGGDNFTCTGHPLATPTKEGGPAFPHTYIYTHTNSGFPGFPYFSKTTFSLANKDHLSCFFQTTDTTGRLRRVGTHGEQGTCQWHRPSVRERAPRCRRRRNELGITPAQECRHCPWPLPQATLDLSQRNSPGGKPPGLPSSDVGSWAGASGTAPLG